MSINESNAMASQELANIHLLDSVLLTIDQLHGLAYIMEDLTESATIDDEQSSVYVALARMVRACANDLERAADESRAARVTAK